MSQFRGSLDNMHPIKEDVKSIFSSLDSRFAAPDGVTGVRTGIPSLDECGGMHPGEIVVVAGARGAGKTSLALDVAVNATASGAAVQYFALAETKSEIVERLLVRDANVQDLALRRGHLTRQDMINLTHAARNVCAMPFLIDDRTDLTSEKLRSIVRENRERDGEGRLVVVVDYLQLLTPEQATGSRDYELARAVRNLVNLAKETQGNVVIVSQLNRRFADRVDTRPQLVDLRDSGAIEDAATAVLFLHALGEIEYPGQHEFILAKHRRRGIAVTDVMFDGATGRFRLPTSNDPEPKFLPPQ